MVAHPRTTLRDDQLRTLNQPRPIVVETRGDWPRTLAVSQPQEGKRAKRARVAQVQDAWRIDDEWWRSPISRHYYRLVLDDGSLRTIYQDLVAGEWYEQRY